MCRGREVGGAAERGRVLEPAHLGRVATRVHFDFLFTHTLFLNIFVAKFSRSGVTYQVSRSSDLCPPVRSLATLTSVVEAYLASSLSRLPF